MKVLDYQEYRSKSNALVVDVPEPGIFVKDGEPAFPFAQAKRKALREGNPLELLSSVPMDGGEPAPNTPAGPKSRSVYIAVDRILKLKETPRCKGCAGTSRLHTEEFRRRFAALVEAEKAEARERRDEPEAAEGAAPSAPDAEADVVLFEEEPEVPASVVQITIQKATTYNLHCLDCSGDKLPRFDRPKSFFPACMASKDPSGSPNQTNDIKFILVFINSNLCSQQATS